MTTAIYALSGDPITFGHINIIERASKTFDKLIVALGNNPAKKYCLTSEERLKVAKQALIAFPNVDVVYFDGLLVDFAYEQGASVMVRGIRSATDMDFEQNLDSVNASLDLPIDTFLLFAKPSLSHVSSSNVKALQKENAFVHDYVPLPVKQLLEKKISHQFIIGVTGIMGSGKSYVGSKLEEVSAAYHSLKEENPLVHNIELDDLVRDIYQSEKPAYVQLKHRLKERFGSLDKAVISQKCFGDDGKDNLKFLNEQFAEPIMVMLRQKIRGKEGIILLNGALIVEGNLLSLCNNVVMLVSAEDEVRHQRLEDFRGISKEDSSSRVKTMFSNKKKETLIKEKIKKDYFGMLIKVSNDENLDIKELYADLVKLMDEV